jgi:putative transposase
MWLRLRNEIAGATYHVIARGVDRRRIFVDEQDWLAYLRLLAMVVERQGWHLLCYCLMPNHVHLLIETPTTNLGNGMQLLHGQYARAFNARHKRKGHLFETRYLSPLVDGRGLARTAAYIVANPVAAGLCRDAAGWRWGSHAAVVRPDRAPSWLAHDLLAGKLAAAGKPYDELVAARGRALATARLL